MVGHPRSRLMHFLTSASLFRCRVQREAALDPAQTHLGTNEDASRTRTEYTTQGNGLGKLQLLLVSNSLPPLTFQEGSKYRRCHFFIVQETERWVSGQQFLTFRESLANDCEPELESSFANSLFGCRLEANESSRHLQSITTKLC